MTINVIRVWTNNELEQTWHVDEDGQLVCSHINIETEPAQHGGMFEPSHAAYDWCTDCDEVIEREFGDDDREYDSMVDFQVMEAVA